MFHARRVIVRAVSGRDVNRAGAGVERDEVREEDARFPVEERVGQFGGVEVAALEGREGGSAVGSQPVAAWNAGRSASASTRVSTAPVCG